MLKIIDVDGKEFVFQAQLQVTDSLDGNNYIEAEFLPNHVNNYFLKDLSPFWKIMFEGNSYTIVICETKTIGNHQSKRIKAILSAYDRLSTLYMHRRFKKKAHTLDEFLTEVFYGTGLRYRIEGAFGSSVIFGLGGGDIKLNCFKRVLKTFNAEFVYVHNVFVVKKRIGEEKNVKLHTRINVANISKSVDCQKFYTGGLGYGDYSTESVPEDDEPWEYAQIIVDYTSPYQAIIGRREAPPIKNGNIKYKETMIAQIKELVESSISREIQMDIIEVKNSTTDTSINLLPGDTVEVYYYNLKIDEKIRVQERKRKFDGKGNLLDGDYLFSTSSMKVF